MPIKKEFVSFCRKVYERGFVSAYDGNISLRLSKRNILITPSALPKIEVQQKDLIVINLDGEIIEGKRKSSTESKLHTFIYKKRNDVNAVIHCHPIYTSVLSILKKKINFAVFPEVVLTLGKIPFCKYATPSTNEVTKSIEPFVEHSSVFILQNHGTVAVGKDLRDAYYKIEKLESFAKIIVNALQIGDIRNLSKENLTKLYSISEKTYNFNIHPKNRFI